MIPRHWCYWTES